MAELSVVEISATDTYAIRREVLRNDTPSHDVGFDVDESPGTFHLGVHDGTRLVAISTWALRPHQGEPGIQLRGMATVPDVRGTGVGALLLEAGCERAAAAVTLVWARARDTALGFYLRHGFTVDGDGFIDETTGKPHHLITRRLS